MNVFQKSPNQLLVKPQTLSAFLLFIFLSVPLMGQWSGPAGDPPQALPEEEPADEPVYHRNLWISGGIIGTGLIANSFLLPRIKNKETITEEEIAGLQTADVPGFDRWALRQDPSRWQEKHRLSDYVWNFASATPLLLMLDREIRSDWVDIALMYLETHAVSSLLYSGSPFGPNFTNRYRPAVYYQDIDPDHRTNGEQRNSFFSGHVSEVAASTFFAARVYADYHPELGAKKYIFYGLALVPPVASGILRIQALKHFPSDTMVGLGVGIASGLLVPTLHKHWLGRGGDSRIAVRGFYGAGAGGAALALRF